MAGIAAVHGRQAHERPGTELHFVHRPAPEPDRGRPGAVPVPAHAEQVPAKAGTGDERQAVQPRGQPVHAHRPGPPLPGIRPAHAGAGPGLAERVAGPERLPPGRVEHCLPPDAQFLPGAPGAAGVPCPVPGHPGQPVGGELRHPGKAAAGRPAGLCGVQRRSPPPPPDLRGPAAGGSAAGAAPDHPLARRGEARPGFHYPRMDLRLLARDPFVLHYPEQTTGRIAQEYA